jgi:hypothetical protein
MYWYPVCSIEGINPGQNIMCQRTRVMGYRVVKTASLYVICAQLIVERSRFLTSKTLKWPTKVTWSEKFWRPVKGRPGFPIGEQYIRTSYLKAFSSYSIICNLPGISYSHAGVPHFNALARDVTLIQGHNVYHQKTRGSGPPYGDNCKSHLSHLCLVRYRDVTERWTNRQTDRLAIAYTCMSTICSAHVVLRRIISLNPGWVVSLGADRDLMWCKLAGILWSPCGNPAGHF